MSFGHNGFGDVRGDFGLRTAGPQESGHPRMDPVDCRTGCAQGLDLGRVLNHPQGRHDLSAQNRNRAESLSQGQQVQRRHRVGDRDPRVPAERQGHQVAGAHRVPQAVGGDARALLTADFTPAFFVVAAVSAASVFSFWRLAPNAGLVTVIDGPPATLSWLGGVRGHRVAPLGVDHFGQSGDVPDLYRAYGLDAEAILDAAALVLA